MAGHGSDCAGANLMLLAHADLLLEVANGNQTLNPRRHRAERDGSLERHTSKGPQPVKESMVRVDTMGARFITVSTETIVIIVLLVILFGGGGGYWFSRRR